MTAPDGRLFAGKPRAVPITTRESWLRTIPITTLPGSLRAALLASLLAAMLAAPFPAAAERIRILVQSSPLAGSQYYALDRLRQRIKVGDALELVREPDNPHDPNAVAVRWQGEQLGYLPRRENRSVARAIDDGLKVRASVSRLHLGAERIDPWQRLEVAVHVEL